MITLEQLGPDGVRQQIQAQDLAEMSITSGSATDLSAPKPSALGIGGALTRKRDAEERLLIDHELHAKLIKCEIWRLYDTEDGREATARNVKVTRNVLKVVANRLAVVYDRPPVRKFGPGGSKRMARAWRETVLTEGKYDMQAERWARYAFLLNVVHVIPKVVDGELLYETILPHAADVIFDAGERQPSILAYLSDGGDYCRVAVDAERFWYLDANWKIVDEFRHGYMLDGKPMKPWTEWRVRSRIDTEDYWQRGEGRQLVDATMSVGVTAARMRYTRRVNSGKLSTLSAPNLKDDVPPNQQVSPERPLLLKNAEFEVHDLVVEVAPFVAEMDTEVEEIAEAYGVHTGVIDKTKSTDPFADHTAIAKVRDRQIPHLRAADLETSIKTAVIMRADGHPATRELDPRRVARTIQVSFQALSFLSDPAKRFDTYTKELSLGLVDHVTLRQREHPDEDRSRAEAEVRASIERRNEFSNLLAIHNLPADAGEDANNVAQLQGRIGGMSTTNPDGNEDERRQPAQQ